MPNDSLLIRKSISARDSLGDAFFRKKKKDLAEIDEFIKNANDPDYKLLAMKHRNEVANKGYTKEEIDARVRRAKLNGMKK